MSFYEETCYEESRKDIVLRLLVAGETESAVESIVDWGWRDITIKNSELRSELVAALEKMGYVTEVDEFYCVFFEKPRARIVQ